MLSKFFHNKKNLIPAFLMSPGMIILTIGFFIPLIMLFVVSFYQGVSGSGIMLKEATLDNYINFMDPYYATIIFRTFKIALFTSIASLILGYPVAMMISKSTEKMKTILLAVVLTPLLTNVVARTLGLMIILGKHGPINQLLGLFNIAPVKFIPGELGIVVGLTQVFMPYMILSISGILGNIDFSLEEAARDLGCSRMGAFWKVIFPLSMPGIVAGSLFVFLLSFSSFVTPRLLGGGKVMVITMLIYQQAMQLINWPFAAAASFVLLFFSTIMITLYSKATASTNVVGVAKNIDSKSRTHKLRAFKRKIGDGVYNRKASIARSISSHTQKIEFAESFKTIVQSIGKVLLKSWKVIIVLFIVLPLPLVILSSFSATSIITFPPTGFSLQWYKGLVERTEYVKSFFLSLRLALLSVVISLSVGTLASLALARYDFKGKEFIRSVFLSPLSLPAVIVGIALLRFLAYIQWVATFQGLMLAHLVLTTAYVVRTVSASLIGFDLSIEEAARDLGASAFYTLRKITLPIIKPGLIVAGIFAFIVSFDETTVSIFITGGRTITLPVRIFSQLEYGLDPTVTAVSSLLILMSVTALLLIGKVFGLEKFSIK
ncbi:ABC transporter permease subunit [Clostridia bacterium]|nr:ABC transporter permease subunit [Clostridia bacterium]